MLGKTSIKMVQLWAQGLLGTLLVILALVWGLEAISAWMNPDAYRWGTGGNFTWNYQSPELYVATSIFAGSCTLLVGAMFIRSIRIKTRRAELIAWAGLVALLLFNHSPLYPWLSHALVQLFS